MDVANSLHAYNRMLQLRSEDGPNHPFASLHDHLEDHSHLHGHSTSLDQGPGPATFDETPPRDIRRQYRARASSRSQSNLASRPDVHLTEVLTSEETIDLFKKATDDSRKERDKALAATNHRVTAAIKPMLTLDLGRSHIGRLPEAVIDIIITEVERLSLSRNQLTFLPLRLSECHQLRYINIRSNGFGDIPEVILRMPLLEILDVSKNSIPIIPPGIKNLESLRVFSIQFNKLTTLPIELVALTRLKVLKVAGNPFREDIRQVLEAKENEVSFLSMNDNDKDAAQTTELLRFLRKQDPGATPTPLPLPAPVENVDAAIETPKPLKRVFSGRFPVIPAAIPTEPLPDNPDSSPNQSQGRPPIIPLKSHLRGMSGQSNGAVKRPSVSPVINGNERNRSNSESILQASTAVRQRRTMAKNQRSDLDSIDETKALRNSHARGFSYTSGLRRNASISSPGGASSSPLSPRESRRDRSSLIKRLSSLPEHRTTDFASRPIMEAARGILYALFQLYPHVQSLITASQKSGIHLGLEKYFYNSSIHIDKLNKDIDEASAVDPEDKESLDRAEQNVQDSCATCVKGFVHVLASMQENAHKLVRNSDLRYIRTLMLLVYGSIIEVRNAVRSLGIDVKSHRRQMSSGPTHPIPTIPEEDTPPQIIDHARASSRDLNALTLKPAPRLRSDTVLQRSSPATAHLQLQPQQAPVQLPAIHIPRSGHSHAVGPHGSYVRGSSAGASISTKSYSTRSRSNSRSTNVATAIEPSATTTRTNGSVHLPPPNLANMRSHSEMSLSDAQEEAQFEQIFMALTKAYETALQGVPIAMKQFQRGLDLADENRQPKEIQDLWFTLTRRCRSCLDLSEALHLRLTHMRIKDSGVGLSRGHRGRNDPSFWIICKSFLQSFIDLVTDMRDAKALRMLPPEVVGVLRPVQRTSRDAGRLIENSPWRSLAEGIGQMPAPTPFGSSTHMGPTDHLQQPNTNAPHLNGNLSAYSSALGQQALNQAHGSNQFPLHNVQFAPPTPLSSLPTPSLHTPSSTIQSTSPLSAQLPATPLSAALGPAAQATIPSTPASAYGDSFFKGNVFQRADSLLNMQQAGSVNFLNR